MGGQKNTQKTQSDLISEHRRIAEGRITSDEKRFLTRLNSRIWGIIEVLKNGIILFFQLSTTIFTAPFSYLILKTRIVRPVYFIPPRGTLFISNHQSKLDPFLITYHVGAKNYPVILPMRFPVMSSVMRIPFIGLCIRLLGGYDIKEKPFERAKQLLYTRELLRRGTSVLIFPEGRIARNGDHVEEFYKGIEMILMENIPLVLVRLKGLNRSRFRFFYRSSQTEIIFSDSIKDIPKEEKKRIIREFYGKDVI